MTHMFYIFTKDSEISVQIPFPVSFESQKIFVRRGTLAKLIKTVHQTKAHIQVLDFVNNDPIWENLYSCSFNCLKKIDNEFWPYLISISNNEDRICVLGDRERCKFIQRLKCGDLVFVSGEYFKKCKVYDCIIRYIGFVPEIGAGYFFGLELLNLDNGYSPQANDIPFIAKYMLCDKKLSFFLAANSIINSKDAKHKFKAQDFLCLTLDRAKKGIEAATRQSSLRRTGKRVCFNNFMKSSDGSYDVKLETADMDPNYNKIANLGSLSPASNKRKSKLATTSDCFQNKEKENPNKILQKDKSSQNDLISLENEDYTRFVEGYERNLENKHEIDRQKQPTGILKQTKTKKKTSTIGANVKPNIIMSLEDRDIVVIDKADIKESTMNESEVIVVDKSRRQNDVDLIEILGANWPSTAGDAALVLNNDNNKTLESNNSSGTIRNERNKSGNSICHLAGNKGVEKRNKEFNLKQTNDILVGDNTAIKATDKKFKSTDHSHDTTNASVSSLPTALENENIIPSQFNEVPGTNLEIGSMVEVSTDISEDLYGVIRWIGYPQNSKNIMIGVELEDEQNDKTFLTDGTLNGIRMFKCQKDRALFVTPSQCSQDKRFSDIETTDPPATTKNTKSFDVKMFGQMDCPPIAGSIPPLKILNSEDLELICGKFKGIQGHHNSCYLDATLFAMFTFTSVFDSLLFRPPEPEDIPNYEEVQKVLREEIVNPLRKKVFVRADRVMKLRQLLDKLSSVSGLTSEEKDPEEFLNSLLAQIMRAEPFLKLSSGQDTFYYQLFVEKDERLSFPTVQQLFEQSFWSSDIKLKEVPSCLIIQMPRFGKNFKMYPRILPSQVLDVTDIIEDSPRQCTVCGKLAEFECRECFGNSMQGSVGLENTALCKVCLDIIHSHAKRTNHTFKPISVPQDFKIIADDISIPRLFMELFAVVCIETSHYVAFVKSGPGSDAPWCFFDSMADRKGEQNGYNIPEMVSVADLPKWLSEDGVRIINEAAFNDKLLPEHAKRLLCDAYMCMYQSTDVMMYR